MTYTPIYSTADKVKREAGLYGNSNIVDATDIEPYLFDAEGEVTGAVGQRYTLPLSANSSYSNSSAQATVANIATQLAAGFVLLRQYEGQGGDLSNMALGKISHARSRLKMIENGDLKLYDSANAELATRASGGAGLTGYPTAATAIDDPASGAKYTMNQTF